jgi:hypothetical protein
MGPQLQQKRQENTTMTNKRRKRKRKKRCCRERTGSCLQDELVRPRTIAHIRPQRRWIHWSLCGREGKTKPDIQRPPLIDGGLSFCSLGLTVIIMMDTGELIDQWSRSSAIISTEEKEVSRTCPMRFDPCLVDDLDVSSFAVVVGCKPDCAFDRPDRFRRRSVHKGHPMWSNMVCVNMDCQ